MVAWSLLCRDPQDLWHIWGHTATVRSQLVKAQFWTLKVACSRSLFHLWTSEEKGIFLWISCKAVTHSFAVTSLFWLGGYGNFTFEEDSLRSLPWLMHWVKLLSQSSYSVIWLGPKGPFERIFHLMGNSDEGSWALGLRQVLRAEAKEMLPEDTGWSPWGKLLTAPPTSYKHHMNKYCHEQARGLCVPAVCRVQRAAWCPAPVSFSCSHLEGTA